MPVRSLGTVVPENTIRFLGHDTHTHAEPHLVYVVSGIARMTVDGEPLMLRRRESVWLASHVPHSVSLSDDGMVLGPLLDAADAPQQRVRTLGVVPALAEVMTTILGAAPRTAEQVAPFRAAIGRILQRQSRQYFPVSLPTHPVCAALARDALRLPYTLERLAEKHRMSPRQVQRVFLEETGVPFARWRSRARMNAAVALLLGGSDLAIAARASGYATRAGLVRALSRETGVLVEDLIADPATSLQGAAAHYAHA